MDSKEVSLPSIHQDYLGLPHLININRHDHRISRIVVLGFVDSLCGVCHQKMDSTYGNYSCQKCPDYVVHSKCATKKDVWNGKELEGVPEEKKDTDPYVKIDDNTIQHFSHNNHHLRLNVNGLLWEENKRCNACIHPICLHSFYQCMNCEFILHQNCVEFPRKKRHVLHNERLTLVTSEADLFQCDACGRISNGFRYQNGDKKFDVMCCSISEPFFHPSHPHHSLYYTPENKSKRCDDCNNWRPLGVRCIEADCGFFLGFECVTLPQVVSLHKEGVLGDFIRLMPRSIVKYREKSYEVVLNNNISCCPICWDCELNCIPPIILKMHGTSSDKYFCSLGCLHSFLYF